MNDDQLSLFETPEYIWFNVRYGKCIEFLSDGTKKDNCFGCVHFMDCLGKFGCVEFPDEEDYELY